MFALRADPQDREKGVTTYSAWLDDQAKHRMPGPVGTVAAMWFEAKGTRPRYSTIEKVNAEIDKMWSELGGYDKNAAGHALYLAASAYQQRDRPADGPHGAEPRGVPAAQEPAERTLPETFDQAAIPAMFAAIGRVESKLDAVLAWQNAQDARLEPITRLLEALGDAEDEADTADELGTLPAPQDGVPAGDGLTARAFYGGHILTPAHMDALADGATLEEGE